MVKTGAWRIAAFPRGRRAETLDRVRRGEWRLPLILGGIIAGLLTGNLGADDQPSPPMGKFSFEQPLMGTLVVISVYADDQPSANAAAQAAFEEMRRLVSIFSDYDAHSELRQLCARSAAGVPVPVSPELWEVLDQSLHYARLSEGAFDVSVGPLVELWRISRRRGRLPDPARLQSARDRVGWEGIRLHPCRREVELLRSDMRIDLGGIAKGYIADAGLRVLQEQGFPAALIDAGGDIVTGAPPPGTQGWRIGVASLTQPDEPPARWILLNNAAVASSGDAYRFIEIDGQRYSHLIDPRTGLGLTTPIGVTVVAPDGMTADALASAASVLGPERGLALLEQIEGVEGLIVILDEEQQPVVFTTSGWNQLEVVHRDRLEDE